MKNKLAIPLMVIAIAFMVSTDALALIKCGPKQQRKCDPKYTSYKIGGSCTCVYTGSLLEEVTNHVGNEDKKYPAAVEITLKPVPVCWDDRTLYDGDDALGKGDGCDDIEFWEGQDCDDTPPNPFQQCESGTTTQYELAFSCGAPGNKNPAYGINKQDFPGVWTGEFDVTKRDIDRNGIAVLLLELVPPAGLIEELCPNKNWHGDALPLRAQSTTVDIVAIAESAWKCYERSVSVDYFELLNPDKVFATRDGWFECKAWEGDDFTGNNCTESVPATYQGLNLEYYDWTNELSLHPYNGGTCPDYMVLPK